MGQGEQGVVRANGRHQEDGESASWSTLEDEERGGLQRGAAVQANLAGKGCVF